ncbi:hypothetical protein [Thermovibrio sp.]
MSKFNFVLRLLVFNYLIILFLLIPNNSYPFILEQLKAGIGNLSPSSYIEDVYKDRIRLPTSSAKSLFLSYSAENIPFVPDMEISYLHLNSSSKSTVNNGYSLFDLTLNTGDSLLARISANNIKLTLYTQPLDRFNYDFINTKLGVNLHFIDYTVKLTDLTTSQSEEKEISTLVPSLHLGITVSPIYYLDFSLKADLPFGAKKREKNIEFEFKYYLNSQMYTFYSYGYRFLRVNRVNDSNFKITGHMVLVGLGLLW